MCDMQIIDCADLVKAGAWALAGCCPRCHAGECYDGLCLDLATQPGRGLLQLQVCCEAALRLDHGRLSQLFPVSAAPAAP